jgi:hypothetical protein
VEIAGPSIVKLLLLGVLLSHMRLATRLAYLGPSAVADFPIVQRAVVNLSFVTDRRLSYDVSMQLILGSQGAPFAEICKEFFDFLLKTFLEGIQLILYSRTFAAD